MFDEDIFTNFTDDELDQWYLEEYRYELEAEDDYEEDDYEEDDYMEDDYEEEDRSDE